MLMLGAITKNRKFWRSVGERMICVEVIPSAAAMLTAYTDELVKAMREGVVPPAGSRHD